MKTQSTKGLANLFSDHLLVRQFTLSVIAGPNAGLSYTTRRDRATIGTHPSADFVLSDETLSRFHCEIALEGERVVVTDLGSKNGTLVDGVPVKIAFLRDPSRLQLGHSEISFRLGEESARIPLSSNSAFGLLSGGSQAMRAVFAVLERAAPSQTTILLTGETGTGKDLAAESIHLQSERENGPFVVIDCGAVAPNLIESELFGHERGAFTGADHSRQGAFELADGGTLFLDEVGELSLELQPKLLRALENRKVQRMGGKSARAVDVRIIAATNRDLKCEVNARRFRSDLYFRLAVMSIALPPLRDRLEDLPLLVDCFLERAVPDFRRQAAVFRSETFLDELGRHSWPGNVRELHNYLQSCLTLKQRPPIPTPESLPSGSIDIRQPLSALKEQLERQYLEALLKAHAHQVSEAAKAAGIARSQFYRLLTRYGLR